MAKRQLDQYDWNDRERGLTYTQKRRSLRHVYKLAMATITTNMDMPLAKTLLRDMYKDKLEELRANRHTIRRNCARDLRVVRRCRVARHLLRILRA